MRNNYLNTPSSFGFTSESSYSPALVSGRSNLLDNNHLIEESFLMESQERAEDESQQQFEEYSSRYSSQKMDYNIQEIYQGLNKIKIAKNLKMIVLMIERQLKNFKLMAFQFFKLQAKVPCQVNVKTRKALLLIWRTSCWFKRQLVVESFKKIESRVVLKRKRQIIAREFFGKHFLKQLNIKSILSLYLLKWKTACRIENLKQGQVITNKLTQSKHFKFVSSLLKSLINKNILWSFRKLKTTVANILPKDKQSNFRLSENPKEANHFIHKMFKNTQKFVQYQTASQIIGNLKGIYKTTAILRKKIRPLLSNFFIRIKENLKSHGNNNDKNWELSEEVPHDEDSPQIMAGILKHICWLSSKRSQKNMGSKILEKARMKALREIILARERREGNRVRDRFFDWKNRIICERQQIMKKVKQLQLLKESYIESYK